MTENITSTSEKKKKSEVWEWLQALAIALLLAWGIRTFIFAPFLVEGESMLYTLHDREKLVVNKAIYFMRDPKPGEIIVFHAEPTRDYIKRVIAVAGDTVQMRDDVLLVNGKQVDEPYLKEKKEEAKENGNLPLTKDFGPIKVPPDHIYVLGDNRQNSTDSRVIGPVDVKTVVGRSEFVFWPLSDIRITR